MQVIIGCIILFVLVVGAAILIQIAPFLLIIFACVLIKVIFDIYNQQKDTTQKYQKEYLKTLVLDKNDKNTLHQETENEISEVRKKVNEIATQYVEQFIIGNYPQYKCFSNEEIAIFNAVLKDSLTEKEVCHLKNIGTGRILQIKYNSKSYNKFKEMFIKDSNLTKDDDFITYIIAYLNIFDENVEELYYFCRLIQDEKIKLISNENIKKYSRDIRQKIIAYHSKISEIVHYFEKAQTDTFASSQEFSMSYAKDFLEIAQEIIQIFQFEQKVRIAKTNMETGQKAINNFATIKDIDGLDGIAFEHLLGLLFKQMNYKVEVTRGSGDQGADIVISKMGRKTVVQAKCYLNNVSNKAIQEVVAAIKYYNADAGMVVTNSYYTKGAIELAQVNNIVLWDRDKLAQTLLAYPVILEDVQYY